MTPRVLKSADIMFIYKKRKINRIYIFAIVSQRFYYHKEHINADRLAAGENSMK
ncbi:hypothetical protein KSF_019280 [Reticulibacter mediterranei]|uniref:Uncharacterized protein n=1 Tax=Reticulibacter mediterranei TaxID=2778369 RepID=A0A8J3IG76_9CHLR|nr:hypothetical protein KSF_019280 [Reticulibacter mediterranei]